MKNPPDASRRDGALSPEGWARVRALVEGALALPPDARPAFLDAACGGDEALRHRVERLAAACDRAGGSWGFLAHPAGELVAPLLVADGTVMPDPTARADGPPAAFCAALADRYAVKAELGHGGMATVYLAEDLRHHRRVALKVLDPHLGAMLGAERFLAEIRITAGLQHPNLLPLFDSGEAAGLLYYVMPLIEGATLRARLERERQLPVDEAVRIVSAIAGALDYAHRHGVVHRDLKPENILLQDGQPLVADFGIALAVTSADGTHLTAPGILLGTPRYMSPEQAAGDGAVDGRSDTYSLACVLYELLAGEPPFAGRTVQAVIASVRADPPRRVRMVRPSVPAHIDAALARALARLPDDRYPTARAFADALAIAPMAEPTGAAPVEPLGAPGALEGAMVHPGFDPSGDVSPDVASAPGGTGRATPHRHWARWSRHRWRILIVAAAAVAGFVAWRAFTPSTTPTARRLAVLPLENRTSGPETDDLGEYAADWIARWIDLAGPIDVIPASTVRDAIRALDSSSGRPPSTADLAERIAASHIVSGSVARIGGSIRFEVEFVDAVTDQRLHALDPVSGPADSLDAIIDRLAQRAAAAAVVLLQPSASPSWTGGYTVPATITLYRDYLATFERFCQERYQDVITMGDRVLERSPGFIPVMALVRIAYWNLGRASDSDSVYRLLEQQTHRMTNTERIEHDWMAGSTSGDISLATRSAEALFRIDPTSKFGYVAGYTALRTHRVSDALERFLAVDLDLPCQSAWFPWWSYTTAAYHLLGRYDEELALARSGFERFPDHPGLYEVELRVFAARGDLDAVDSLIALVAELPPQRGFVPGKYPVLAALELRAHESGQHADRLLRRGLDWFAGRPPTESRYERGQALHAAGRWADADTLFAGLIEGARVTDNSTYLNYLGYRGVSLARLGRRDEALAVSRRLELTSAPGVLRIGYGTAWRAAIATALGDKETALAMLGDAFRNGYPYGIQIHQDPWWDPLRKDPAFRTLARPR